MKYPYIGKVELGHIYLMVSESKGVIINSSVTRIGFGGDNPVNITREYLEGKCVKIESPEHGDFVIELCKNGSIGLDKHDNKPWAYIEGGELYFTSSVGEMESGDSFKEITIPLPPKEVNAINAYEFLKVGDEVLTRGGSKGVLLINKPDKDGMVICNFDGEYALTYLNELKKPKTEAEILRDDLIELTLNHMENKSHPIEANAYYLVSDLIDKYITKKPQ